MHLFTHRLWSLLNHVIRLGTCTCLGTSRAQGGVMEGRALPGNGLWVGPQRTCHPETGATPRWWRQVWWENKGYVLLEQCYNMMERILGRKSRGQWSGPSSIWFRANHFISLGFCFPHGRRRPRDPVGQWFSTWEVYCFQILETHSDENNNHNSKNKKPVFPEASKTSLQPLVCRQMMFLFIFRVCVCARRGCCDEYHTDSFKFASESTVTSDTSRYFQSTGTNTTTTMWESTECLEIIVWPSFLQSLGMSRILSGPLPPAFSLQEKKKKASTSLLLFGAGVLGHGVSIKGLQWSPLQHSGPNGTAK